MTKEDLDRNWKQYEQEKAKLNQENLTPDEYTRRIVEICDRLQI